jgi:hypothetical protein
MNVITAFPCTRPSRRLATRRGVTLPCQAVRERDFKLIADRTLDISVDGLLLPVEERILTGETLIISFPIPGLWIDVEASVTRVVHGRRPGDDGLACGVLFDVISPSARAALAGFLHGKPPPLPRRGPLARMRRGEGVPRLADETAMASHIAPPPKPVEPAAVGVLRELATAWKRILLANV